MPGERVGERSTGHVLGDAVEQPGERDLLWGGRPISGKDLVRPPAEQQGVHVVCLLEQDAAGLLASQWRLPPAVPEAVVAVLVGPSRRLSYPVQGHELGHDELAHGVSSPWWRCQICCRSGGGQHSVNLWFPTSSNAGSTGETARDSPATLLWRLVSSPGGTVAAPRG